MNIYQKINQVRQTLLGLQIKAETKGYNYMYIDLPKIEGAVTRACGDAGLVTIINFPEGKAEMEIVDIENEDSKPIKISVPVDSTMVRINDKQPIQNVGGMMTYMRRYLYMTAFCISEHDAVPELPNGSEETAPNGSEETAYVTEPQKKVLSEEEMKQRCEMLDYLRALNPEAVDKMISYKKVNSIDELETEYIRKVYQAKKGAQK